MEGDDTKKTPRRRKSTKVIRSPASCLWHRAFDEVTSEVKAREKVLRKWQQISDQLVSGASTKDDSSRHNQVVAQDKQTPDSFSYEIKNSNLDNVKITMFGQQVSEVQEEAFISNVSQTSLVKSRKGLIVQILAVVAIAIGHFLDGAVLAYPSTAIPSMRNSSLVMSQNGESLIRKYRS